MPELKYLFECEFLDGSIYRQNPDDASIKFPPIPDKEGHLQGKSCMADIQEALDNFNIKRFTLIQDRVLFPKTYSVNLETGEFNINGQSIEVEGNNQLPLGIKLKFKLIYFRVRRPFQTLTYKVGKPGDDPEIIKRKYGELPIKYMIGWECNINGKNYTSKVIIP